MNSSLSRNSGSGGFANAISMRSLLAARGKSIFSSATGPGMIAITSGETDIEIKRLILCIALHSFLTEPKKAIYRSAVALGILDPAPRLPQDILIEAPGSPGVATTQHEAHVEPALNRIHQGDCIAGLRGMPAGTVDLAFADPPFNIGYDYDVYDDKQN